MLANIPHDKDIANYLLILMNNILEFQLSSLQVSLELQKKEFNQKHKLSKLINTVLLKYQNFTNIIEKVIKILLTLHLDEILIKEILEYGISN